MTSIEWLEGQILNLMSFDTVDFRKEFREKFEQAKEMHKQEIIQAHDMGYIDGGNHKKVTAEMYYAETFVSKGSDDKNYTEKYTDNYPELDGINNLIPQQEISDEEIDSAWEIFRIQNPNTVGGFQDQYLSFCFAMKWYREQLKLKQPKKD